MLIGRKRENPSPILPLSAASYFSPSAETNSSPRGDSNDVRGIPHQSIDGGPVSDSDRQFDASLSNPRSS